MIVEAIIFVIVIFLLVKLNQKPAGLPPGEWGLPILGYLPNRRERLTSMIERLREKHGDIFTVKLGARVSVFLCNYEAIRSSFSKTTTTGRPNLFSFRLISKSKNTGLVLSSGHVWLSNRRLALQALKDFGMGKSSLEGTIIVETEYFTGILKKNTDKPFKIGYALNVTILNVVWGLVKGKRFDIEDEEILMFTTIFFGALSLVEGPMMILDLYPWIIPYVPKFLKNSVLKVDQVEKMSDLLHAFFMKVVKECEKTLDKDDPRHYIDMYLIEREEQKHNPDFNFRTCDYEDLMTSLSDIFLAGSDTTSATLKWMFLYMAKNQDVQKKIQKEIDSVVPRSRFPQLDDKASLPYTEAAIYELQRIVALFPGSIPHITTEDIIIDNYNIPKGTVLHACTQSIHRNPKYWEKPNDFFPEHFLDTDGKFTIRKEGFLPFGLGRRQCLGEALAKMELFLFITSILQNFEISEPDDSPITLKPVSIINFMNLPREQDVFLKYRK